MTGILQIMSVQASTGVFNTTNTFTIENPSNGILEGKEYVLKDEVLMKIALCESGGNQFNKDGSILRGKENPQDIGKWQINEYWNGAKARELGFDIYTLDGNYAMASWLYDKNGTKDWNWSKHCWDK